MVKLKDIKVVFNKGTENEKVALDKISLTIKEGDFVTIIGSNGAGKSTMLKVILGEIFPNSGIYMIDDSVMNGTNSYKLAKFIGRVYQNPNSGVFPNLSIKENLILASKKGMRYLGFSKVSDFGVELLANLGIGLEKRLNTKAGHLSGGQKQSLAMVMSIISRPRLLLLDEHTASLDPQSSEKIMELTKRINIEYGITIMMITHNMEIASKYGNRFVKLSEGRISEDSIRDHVSAS
ncbi:MAG: putative tryptophan/tyrosine transport system ATP-binding protein [Kosmotogales bacterium]|nr:putative tryptophan/tyrosine transport system ATP-binding protein [Kosmotogales bacterium]